MNSHQHEEICVICGEKKTKGIHLYTSFICIECENTIINTEASDPKYRYFIDQLKKAAKPEIFS